MNRDRNVDEIVARWVDDGPETAPERFVWAALERVERTPQRGAWRVALENRSMFAKLSVSIAAVAAVIVAAYLAYGQLTNPNVGDPGPTPGPSGSAEAPASPSAASTDECPNPAVSIPAPDRISVFWCPPRNVTERLVIAFTFDAPSRWADEYYANPDSLFLRSDGLPAIAFAVEGPDTVDEWVEEITAEPAFAVSEPEPIELDGAAGFVLDVRLAADTAAGDAPPVVDDREAPWHLQVGDAIRVWIIDRPGEALAIVTGTPEADFAAWVGEVDAALATLEWGP